MKKRNNALLAALILAFALVIGMLASCTPTPTPVKIPDELQGGWTYSPAAGIYYRYSFDGFGGYKKDYVIGGEIVKTTSSQYSIEGGYLTLQEPKASQYTSSHPEYFYFYNVSADTYQIANSDTDGFLEYPNPKYTGPYTRYGDMYIMQTSNIVAGITTTTASNYSIGSSDVHFSGALTIKDGETLLYKQSMSGSATINKAPSPYPYPAPYFYLYDDTYTTKEKKTKYEVSGDTLRMYEGEDEITYTRY